ncbi:MAG TPA: hypothetical protein VG826_07355 [Pirellulales bacterium]|nr:hypothetical protein [Pirellulales bacterium]
MADGDLRELLQRVEERVNCSRLIVEQTEKAVEQAAELVSMSQANRCGQGSQSRARD